ncbi:hypothetical protein [Hoeflea sp.]|uniref:hypothetical protein n=1 Tax=Hoeflea sp. TaxID=1940281 RepID=UPI0037483A34
MSEDDKRSIGNNIDRAKLICQRVPLDVNSEEDWTNLAGEMRSAQGKLTSRGSIGTEPEFPFSDIVIKGPNGVDENLASSCAEEMEVMFANTPTAFACDVIEDKGIHDRSRFAFFGHGVFAPVDGASEHSAELQFSWYEPQSDRAGKHIQYAKFNADGSKACAWHAGQKGIAIGFSADVTPARLELPAHMEEEARKAFKETFLFIGRDASSAPPSLDLYPSPECNFFTSATAESGNGIRSLGSGDWFRILLKAGDHSLDLWCRYLIRSGQSMFSTVRHRDVTQPSLAVLGFLMPKIRFQFWLNSLRRWFVHFDSDLAMKHADFLETRLSVVRQTFDRLAAYSHQPNNSKNRWTAGQLRPKKVRSVQLSNSTAIELHPFPGNIGFVPVSAKNDKSPEGDEIRKQLRSFYSREDWMLVRFSDLRSIGYIGLQDGVYDLLGAPVSQNETNPDKIGVSIDWLNRMAQLETRSGLEGAASHWASRGFQATIRRAGNTIKVTLEHGDRKKPYQQTILPKHRGMLGPLYVENILGSEDKTETG